MTDNRAVTYLRTKKDLTRREARWIDLLADFDFSITHRPGRENLADSLSRRPDLEAFAIEGQCVLHSEEEHDIRSDYEADRRAQAIIGRLAKPQKDNFHERYRWNDQEHRLYMKTVDRWRLYVPKGAWRLRLLKEHHDAGSAGHPGRARTYSRLARLYFWPGMSIDVKRFVRSCDVCQRMKSGRQNQGLSQPLTVPEQPWQHISMDLIVGLPRTQRGFDSIHTFVDRLTKFFYLVPTTATVDAAGDAQLYINNVFKLHGLSQTITCDRDPRFTAEFFKDVFHRLGTEIKFSTANHPQTDGPSERANRVVGDILRGYVNRQCDWDEHLPLCEFAMNDMIQESISLLTTAGTLVLEEIFYLLFLQIPTFLAIPGYPGWSDREKYFRWCGTR